MEKAKSRDFQKGVGQTVVNLLEDDTCMYVATTLSTVNDQEMLVSELKTARRMLSTRGRLRGKICAVGAIKEKRAIFRHADLIIHRSRP